MIDMKLGDCMDLMAGAKDNAWDLAICDPPFFRGVARKTFYGSEVSGIGVCRLSSISSVWDDGLPGIEYFSELRRVSKHQIVWGANYFNCFNGNGGAIVWDKENDSSSFSNCEIASQSITKGVFVFRHLWNGMIQESGEREIRIHPTQKPVALYKWLLSRYAKPGQTILDTHGGSGSIAIACHDLGFDLTWIEKDADYYEAAVKRYQTHASQLSLFDPKKADEPTPLNLDL